MSGPLTEAEKQELAGLFRRAGYPFPDASALFVAVNDPDGARKWIAEAVAV